MPGLKLFIPGPTPVADQTLAAMMQPPMGHRTPQFSQLWAEVTAGVETLLGAGKVFLCSHPATGLWEATVRNTVNQRCLNLVNGPFGATWHRVTRACGLPCEALEKDWGKAILPADVDRALSSGGFDVVTLVHNETATGVMSPLEDIARLLRDKYPDVLLHVDAVSSMAAVEIQVDSWGLDSCFASVQKAWSLPPGFSVCAVSERTIDRSARQSDKGYFFDFEIYNKYYGRQQTPTTPSLPHIYGLRAILSDIQQEGLPARYRRHKLMAERARGWALDHGQELLAQPGFESVTLTAVRNVAVWDVDALSAALQDRGYHMDRGYGRLKGETFRIAHMGAVSPPQLDEFLQAFDEVLLKEGQAS
ncbi:MAG: alanine--glyoxylate aminotransferase family protein [Candidatus Neomarinimicrobiota bacterium]